MSADTNTGRPISARLLNVKYSPNLGDGLLCECLEHEIRAADPRIDIDSVDLAARTEYDVHADGRGGKLRLLTHLPPAVRQIAVRAALSFYGAARWKGHYARGLSGARTVVVGGGNLMSDMDLNFPSKLNWALAEAQRRNQSLIVYGVGVSSGWSPEGAKLFRQAFSRLPPKAVFVRDEQSKANWDTALGESSGQAAVVVRDPGLLAASVWAATPRTSDRPVAGLGVMSHTALAYHGAPNITEQELANWYLAAAQGLSAAGFSVTLFTNGSPEDTQFLDALRPRLPQGEGAGSITTTTPETPADLAGIVSSVDVVIAHRMHAVIAAYAYGKPAISLAWDSKLAAFARSVDRQDWHMDPGKTSAEDAVKAAIRTHKEGVAAPKRALVLREASDNVRTLTALIGQAG